MHRRIVGELAAVRFPAPRVLLLLGSAGGRVVVAVVGGDARRGEVPIVVDGNVVLLERRLVGKRLVAQLAAVHVQRLVVYAQVLLERVLATKLLPAVLAFVILILLLCFRAAALPRCQNSANSKRRGKILIQRKKRKSPFSFYKFKKSIQNHHRLWTQR